MYVNYLMKKYLTSNLIRTIVFNFAKLLVYSVILIVALFLINRLFNRLEKKSKTKLKFQFLRSICLSFVKIIFFISLLDIFGLNMEFLVTILGAFGISLSIAFKEDLQNISSGISILFNNHVSVNDKIDIDGKKGIVKKITLMYTILTRDGSEVIIPNNLLAKKIFVKEDI